MIAIGKAIQDARAHKGITDRELADRLGVSAQHVRELERGKYHPRLETLYLIAKALGIQAWRILKYAERISE